jgi:hypothetical protein
MLACWHHATTIVTHRYRPEILETLLTHGLRPSAETDPAFVRQALSDLYRHEIRRLRARLLHGEFPRAEYAGRVDTLRRRYVLLKLPVAIWTLPDGPDTPARTAADPQRRP